MSAPTEHRAQGLLSMSFLRTFWTSLRVDQPDAVQVPLPWHDDNGRTRRAGVYVVGACAGTPLMKHALNAGARAADDIHATLLDGQVPVDVDVVVIGAGPAGLACALRLVAKGRSVRVLEAKRIASVVEEMHAGKTVYAAPTQTNNHSDVQFTEMTREALLSSLQQQARTLDVKEFTTVTAIDDGVHGALCVKTAGDAIHCHRVVVAIGNGQPKRLDVPGAEASHVHQGMRDAKAFAGKDVVVVGGGDAACEAALALSAHAKQTTLLVRDTTLSRPQAATSDAVTNAVAQGTLRLELGAHVEAVGQRDVSWRRSDGPAQTTVADAVVVAIGQQLNTTLLKSWGVAFEERWNWKNYIRLLLVFLGVYSLYSIKKYPEFPYAWPFTAIPRDVYARALSALFEPAFAPFAWCLTPTARVEVSSTMWFQQGYLYSLLYTVLMGVFGYFAFVRWRTVAHNPRYQAWRYATLMLFQLVFFVGVNVVGVQALSVQYSWRGWGLYQPWPLFFHTFHWWQDSDPRVMWFFIVSGFLGTLVLIPLLSRRHGKRFCSWVCGCGGMAETLGDRFRHLAPKGSRARAWEFQGVLVLLLVTLVTVITVGMYHTRADNPWALGYAYLVDFWLVAVLPMAAYPFFGGKIWCRYWCPLAAYNQLLARWYGRLGIAAQKDRCISCGQCSTQCQVGIDVMAFAKHGERLDNRNSSCIQCGICIDVCPTQTLAFDLVQIGKRR